LLGIEFVTGRGDVVRAGGKVVKNVAGFDLTRLLTGSWGTLGVITEATVRLYARPKSDRTVVVRLPGDDKQIADLLEVLSSAPVMPFAMEVVSGSIAKALGLGERPACLVRLGGNPAAVDSQLITLARLGRTDEVETRTWEALRMIERDADFVIRLSGLPAMVRAAAGAMVGDSIPGVYTCVNITRGIVRIVAGGSTPGAAAEMASLSLDGPVEGSFVGIRKAYDPFNVLNPGILGD